MSEKKDNPYVSTDTCTAYREGLEARLEAQEKFFEEKFRSVKTVVIAATTTMTLVLGTVQVILTLLKG